jgi:hypothetical protein
MKNNSFTTTLTVDQSPKEVFDAILNVRGWWSGLYGEEIKGKTDQLDEEFTFLAGQGVHYAKQRLVALIPEQRIVWLVTDAKLTFVDKTDEWVGTKLIFDIARKGASTIVTFTHEGLTPELECYDSCSPAWQQYMQEKLLPLLTQQGMLQ